VAQGYTQVPPDSTGDKLWMRRLTVGSDDLHLQGVCLPGLPTYRAIADAIAPASNKYHILLSNNAGSGQSVTLRGLYGINLQTSAVTGVIGRFDLRRVAYGTPAGGSAITPAPMNTADPSLSGVSAYSGATSGVGADGTLLQPIMRLSEEVPAAAASIQTLIDLSNILAAWDDGARRLTLRPGEAVCVKQNNSGAVGSMAWIMDFTVEPD
jgi:hypothetical protein